MWSKTIPEVQKNVVQLLGTEKYTFQNSVWKMNHKKREASVSGL
jgi:hypothetical protein